MVLLLVTVFHTTGCGSRKIPADFDYGNWTGSTYQNDFFGFSITVPEDWHIMEKEEMTAVRQSTPDADFVNKEKMKEVAELADITVADLFSAKRYTTEEAATKEGISNTFIVARAENLPSLITTREQYVELTRQVIVEISPNMVIKSETDTSIGGMEFSSLKTELHVDGICIFQETLICLKSGFCLFFHLTWSDDSEKEQLDAIMATLKWK
jgi:hypothetical protein